MPSSKPTVKPRAKTNDLRAKVKARQNPQKRAATLATLRDVDSDPALIAVDKPLTDMQRAFVKALATGESPMTAAQRAGFAHGESAYRMLRQPNILAALAEEKRLYAEACQMTRKQVMDGFLEAIELARMCEEPGTMVAGWKEVGRMCGYYEPVKIVHTHTNDAADVERQMNSMSDAELLKFIAERAMAARAHLTKEDVTDVEPKRLQE